MSIKKNNATGTRLRTKPFSPADGRVRVVVFDCDGVMFDTAKANEAYYNNVLAHFGLPQMTEEKRRYTQMHTVDESIAYIFENDATLIQPAKDYQRRMRYTPFIKRMEIEPFLVPLLEFLKSEYMTAIATNRTDTMERVLNEFDLAEYFDLVVTARDVTFPKPNPEALIKILDHFRVLPNQAVYIGDSAVDQQAAESSGVHFVAYGNRELSADFHIQSLKEIETVLNALEPISKTSG